MPQSVKRRSARQISSTTPAQSAKYADACAEAQSLLEGIRDLNTKLTREEEASEQLRKDLEEATAERDTLRRQLDAEQARTKSLAKQLKETAGGYGEFMKGIVHDTEFLVGKLDEVARIALVQLIKRLDEVVPTASEAVRTARLDGDKTLKNDIGGEERIIQLLKRLGEVGTGRPAPIQEIAKTPERQTSDQPNAAVQTAVGTAQFEGGNTIENEKGWEESIQPKSNEKRDLEEAGGSRRSKRQKKHIS